MENKKTRLFIAHSRRVYENWKEGKLWGKWMSIYHQQTLLPKDRAELNLISRVLNEKPLPKKREFYSQLGGWEKRLYKEKFLVIE